MNLPLDLWPVAVVLVGALLYVWLLVVVHRWLASMPMPTPSVPTPPVARTDTTTPFRSTADTDRAYAEDLRRQLEKCQAQLRHADLVRQDLEAKERRARADLQVIYHRWCDYQYRSEQERRSGQSMGWRRLPIDAILNLTMRDYRRREKDAGRDPDEHLARDVRDWHKANG